MLFLRGGRAQRRRAAGSLQRGGWGPALSSRRGAQRARRGKAAPPTWAQAGSARLEVSLLTHHGTWPGPSEVASVIVAAFEDHG